MFPLVTVDCCGVGHELDDEGVHDVVLGGVEVEVEADFPAPWLFELSTEFTQAQKSHVPSGLLCAALAKGANPTSAKMIKKFFICIPLLTRGLRP